MSRRRIVFNNPSSEDSLSPAEKRAKQEIWEIRVKRFESGDESDCKIIVGNKTIFAHRWILTEFPYFKKRFESQSSFVDNVLDQINISHYEYAVVYEMVKYMYTLKVNISTENAEDLLLISDEFEVNLLFEKAQKFIVDRIGPKNVIQCLTLTENISCAKLLKSASIDYILDHYFELEATASWKTLSSDLLRDILHHKMLNGRITDINAGNADELLNMAKKHNVKKLTEAVQKFKNQM